MNDFKRLKNTQHATPIKALIWIKGGFLCGKNATKKMKKQVFFKVLFAPVFSVYLFL
ncbi:hypothetical protein ACQR3P_09705 [Rhodococcus sp. IEGM1300]